MVIREDQCEGVEEDEILKGIKKNNSLRFHSHGIKLNKLINQNDLERIKKKMKTEHKVSGAIVSS